VVATKTRATSAADVMRRVEEDLRELETDYVDVFLLRCYTHEMLQAYLAPGGAFDGLLKAQAQGKIRFMGLSNHSDPGVLVAGIETGLVDVVLLPLNIVRREALDTLIPAAQAHDIGLAVMKPLSVGKIPATIGLRWLANQPIHTVVPGISSLEHLALDVAAVEREPRALSPAETAEIERCRQELDRQTCRICQGMCQAVCEQGLAIDWMIHHDVLYEHYRNLGMEAFLDSSLTPWAKGEIEAHFIGRLAAVQSCTRCGLCEERCPHQVPILDMLEQMLVDHPLLIEAARERGWSSAYGDAVPPWRT
jgi:predicted aldo/keto reductase-like oxidoreductase